jgi:hypothetical protein
MSDITPSVALLVAGIEYITVVVLIAFVKRLVAGTRADVTPLKVALVPRDRVKEAVGGASNVTRIAFTELSP